MSVGYNPRIVTDGLVLCLDAANPRCYPGSGSTLYDLIRSQQCTIQGGLTITNDVFVFNGTDAYIDTNKSYIENADISTNTSSAYTLEAWIYVSSVTAIDQASDGHAIIGNASNYGVGMQTWLVASSPTINIGYRFTSNYNMSNATPLNTWQHVVFSYSYNSWANFYVNGELDYQIGPTTNLNVTSGQTYGNLQIGHCTSRMTGYFDGKMGPVRTYNRGLTATEVKQNFNATRGRFGI